MPSRAGFEATALPHLPAVYRLARQLAGPDRADDLVQETFLKAWTHFRSFEAGTNCRAWLFRILHNTWVSQWRKTRLELLVGEREEIPDDGACDGEIERLTGVMSSDVQWALDQLPETHRFAVLLADVEEFTYQEIAATLDCPIGTVMSRLSRGRRMLARLISERRTAPAAPPLRIVGRDR